MTQPVTTTTLAAPTSPTAEAAQRMQAPVQEAPKEPAGEKIRVKGYQRAARVKAKLAEEGATSSEPAAERETPDAASPRQESSSAADSGGAAKPATDPAEDAAEKRRAERAERLRKAQDRERAEDAERAARMKSRQRETDATRELETLRKKLADLEPLNGVFDSEESLLAAAEQKGMSAERLVQWMRTRLTDPGAVAKRAATTEAEKLRAELKAVQDRLDKEAKDREAERARARAEHEGTQKAYGFVARAKASTESHPLTAALQNRYGDAGLINFANQFVAPNLREDYSLEELHDHVEQLLDVLQVGARASGAPAKGASLSSKNGADQPATTLSNRVASERVSVTEETPLHRLPRTERVRRLKEKLGGE